MGLLGSAWDLPYHERNFDVNHQHHCDEESMMTEASVVKIGPEGYENIAILGSAPSSILLAPFDDLSWSIWGTSPSCWAQLQGRRTDVWFEVHRYMPYPPGQSTAPGTRPFFSPEFHSFLMGHKGPVFMTEGHPDIPNCVQYPFQDMLAKHGPFHFSSSVPLMLAIAIEQMPKRIGIFGIDMAAGEEWIYQRPATQHFLGLAKQLGIEIILPPESDLLRPHTIYGLGEHSPRHVRISSRIAEIQAQKAQAELALVQAQAGLAAATASLEAHEYFLATWCDDIGADISLAQSFSGVFKKTIPTGELESVDVPSNPRTNEELKQELLSGADERSKSAFIAAVDYPIGSTGVVDLDA